MCAVIFVHLCRCAWSRFTLRKCRRQFELERNSLPICKSKFSRLVVKKRELCSTVSCRFGLNVLAVFAQLRQ
ncbi:hypothetical protein ScPMuIL_003148 [Solemya velum]